MRSDKGGASTLAKRTAAMAFIAGALVLLAAVARGAAKAIFIAVALVAVGVWAAGRLRKKSGKAMSPAASKSALRMERWYPLPEDDCLCAVRQLRPMADGPWEGYEFRLSGDYGWQYMLENAQYMADADLRDVGSVTAGANPMGENRQFIEEVQANGGRIDTCPALHDERENLGVGGISRTFGVPTKVVWYNRTDLLRVFVRGEARDIVDYARHIVKRDFQA